MKISSSISWIVFKEELYIKKIKYNKILKFKGISKDIALMILEKSDINMIIERYTANESIENKVKVENDILNFVNLLEYEGIIIGDDQI